MPTAAELAAVIQNDTDGIGFKDGATWKGDEDIANLFNTVGYAVSRTEISKADVIAAVPYDEYNGLVADEQEWIRWITAGDGMMKISADVRTQLTNTAADGGIWLNANTDAPAAILALIDFTGTYAESLYGEGTVITPSQVARAYAESLYGEGTVITPSQVARAYNEV
jgi:hypothetical protein